MTTQENSENDKLENPGWGTQEVDGVSLRARGFNMYHIYIIYVYICIHT